VWTCSSVWQFVIQRRVGWVVLPNVEWDTVYCMSPPTRPALVRHVRAVQ